MKHRRTTRHRIHKNTENAPSGGIIPGLPDEVALCILARLPRSLQQHRRLICHAWKDAMEAARMSSVRRALNISEQWPVFVSLRAYVYKNDQFLFTLVDPIRRRRRNITLPQELQPHQGPGAKLYVKVIGAIGSMVLIAAAFYDASKEVVELQGVYSFDGLSMKWGDSKYSSLPNSLSLDCHEQFASATDMVGGHLYLAGGFDKDKCLQGAVRLDAKTRMWEALPDPHVKRESAVGVVLQGIFHLIGGMHAHIRDGNCVRWQVVNSGETWDPATRQWTLVPELWPFEVFGSWFEKTRVVAFKDRLYALRRVFMTDELMCYDSDSKLWISLGDVPLDLSQSIEHRYGLCRVRLLRMGQELWVVDRDNVGCVATEPTFSQPISWRTLPRTFKRALPIHWCRMVAELHV